MVTALATRPINEDSYEASIKLGVSLPEDGSRAGFRNVVFFLNYTMDKAHKREILT